mgnify:FL=1
MQNKPNLFSQDLKPPKTAIQEVLFEMITNGNVSIVSFFWMPSFRTRVSDLKLKHNLPFDNIEKTGKNKFGREYVFQVHVLKNENIELAKSIYKDIQKNSKEVDFRK